jgi:hypothetical protein
MLEALSALCTIRLMRVNRYIRILGLLAAASCGGCARNEPPLPSRGDNADARRMPEDVHRYSSNEKVEFHIPAEAVSEALKAWTEVTHRLYSVRVPEPEPVTQPIDGRFTAAEALCRQLGGTGLTYVVEDRGDGDQSYAIGREGAVFDSTGRHVVPSLSATCALRNPGPVTHVD